MGSTQGIYALLEPSTASAPARVFRCLHHLVLICGIAAMVAATMAPVVAEHGPLLATVYDVVVAFFAVEYVARLFAAPGASEAAMSRPWAARWRWAVSPLGVIDLMAILPFAIAAPFGLSAGTVHLFAIVWVLKLLRHSPEVRMLGRIIHVARQPLLNVLVAFVIVLFIAATLMYVLEGTSHPELFGSIPQTLWWGIVTLTTTGYGDAIPATPLGRILAGIIMVCGIAVFALWAGILATAFAREVSRREFLQTWDLITKVPFFKELGAETIADIARLLKPREVAAGGTVVRRGDPGECMYFIVEGEIEVRLQPAPSRLGAGEFFGELALITGATRRATAVATKPTLLLSLDIADFRELLARRPLLSKVVTEEAARRLGQAGGAPDGVP